MQFFKFHHKKIAVFLVIDISMDFSRYHFSYQPVTAVTTANFSKWQNCGWQKLHFLCISFKNFVCIKCHLYLKHILENIKVSLKIVKYLSAHLISVHFCHKLEPFDVLLEHRNLVFWYQPFLIIYTSLVHRLSEVLL